jgi:hypothetical protein
LKSKLIWLDVIFYLAIPLGIWHFGRDFFGDYIAMLLSTIPGLIYTVYRFFVEKQFNVTGLFIICTLAIGTIVNLIAGSADRLLVYSIYSGVVMSIFYLFTVIIKRPMALYFYIDIAYLQGYARKDSYNLYTQKALFKYFYWITGLMSIKSLLEAGLKLFLYHRLGVKGYGTILTVMNIYGWVFGILITIGFIFIGKKILDYIKSIGVEV